MMFQVGAELAPPYSRLVEQEKAGTFEAIKDMRREVIGPIVAEYHGRIVKLIGDGAIAEFGSRRGRLRRSLKPYARALGVTSSATEPSR